MSVYRLKGTSGSVINQSFPLGEGLVLGSSADCGLQLEGQGIAEHHAEISLVDGKFLRLKDLGSATGTLLNGERVSDAMLGSGDEIRIGDCRWMLQAPGLRPERVLTGDAVEQRGWCWRRIIIWSVVTVLTIAVAVLKWKPEWLAFFQV